jgi:hypothetical protein
MKPFVLAVLLAFAPAAAAVDSQPTSVQDRRKAENASPSSTVSVNCNACDQTNQSKNQPKGWHKFTAWPEGIATWAIMLTLAAIVWQSWETRRSARAALLNIDVMKEQLDVARQKERARLRAELTQDVDLDLTDSPHVVLIDCKIHNHGGSIAFISFGLYKCWIGETSGPEEPESGEASANLPEVLAPGESCDPAIALLDSKKVVDLTMWNTDDPRVEGVRTGSHCIYLTGTIGYTNIFDETWIVKFRRRYTVYEYGSGLAQGIWSKYGAADDNEEYKPN